MAGTKPNEQVVPFQLRPSFITDSPFPAESPRAQAVVDILKLAPHIEGGYFVQTDASSLTIPSPYSRSNLSDLSVSLANGSSSSSSVPDGADPPEFDPALRRLSTTIYYYLSPGRPLGTFHRNRSRIIHTLHCGRGRYVLIHPADGRVETFVVGQRIEEGERLQWIVEGGVWKASFLLESGEDQELLISETVVPGFEYADHEFLSWDKLTGLMSKDGTHELKWLLRKDAETVG